MSLVGVSTKRAGLLTGTFVQFRHFPDCRCQCLLHLPYTFAYLNSPLNSTNEYGTANTNSQEYCRVRDELELFDKLDNAECISYYCTQFESQRGDIILILDNSTSQGILDLAVIGSSVPIDPGVGNAWDWMCLAIGATSGSTSVCPTPPDNWQIVPTFQGSLAYQKATISNCLSRPTLEHGKLQFSLTVMIVVMVCKAAKTACMITALVVLKSPPLFTIGGKFSKVHSNWAIEC